MISRFRISRFRHLALLGILGAAPATLAHAIEPTYPWRNLNGGEIRVIPDARVEADFRLELIERATQSIDFAIYQMGHDDEVGAPVYRALRNAANRGVRVRFLTSAIVMRRTDPRMIGPDSMLDAPTLAPITYLAFGGDSRWRIDDLVHEKLLIVDDKWVMTTGRGILSDDLNWMDCAYVMRGALAQDSASTFEDLWRLARRETPVRHSPAVPTGSQPPAQITAYPRLAVNSLARSAAAQLVAWLNEDPRHLLPQTSENGTPRPRARVLHNHYLEQVLSKGFPSSLEDRIRQIDDSVLEALIERIDRPDTRRIRFSVILPMLHPRLRESLLRARRDGKEVTIITNSEAAANLLMPASLNWRYALPDMAALLDAGATIRELVPSDNNPFIYLHQKLVIVDDTVFFGSHNFSLPSSIYNDEVSYEVMDPRFSDQMGRLFDLRLRLGTRRVSPGTIRSRSNEVWNATRFVSEQFFIGYY